ncbi:MAG: thioredoxin family protein [Flavobacteriales bacterium]
MTYDKYNSLFDEILSSDQPLAPYDQANYFNYAELNKKRQERWDKKGTISDALKTAISEIDSPQKWVLITEPWCGDAAHSVPFIAKIAETNSNIELEIQLRDSDSEIDNYLTNGGKSIPILVVRNESTEDLFVWGPRPTEAQNIHLANLDTDKSMEDKKVELQKWYNQDKGQELQNEILALLKN